MRYDRRIWQVIAALSFIFAVGVALAIDGGAFQDSKEVGKAGLQLAVIAVLGGGVAFLYRQGDSPAGSGPADAPQELRGATPASPRKRFPPILLPEGPERRSPQSPIEPDLDRRQ